VFLGLKIEGHFVVNINFGRGISTTISLDLEYTPSLLNYKPRLII
jgi:hypothetical protein